MSEELFGILPSRLRILSPLVSLLSKRVSGIQFVDCDFVLGNTPSLLFIPLGNHAPSRYSLEALRGKQERQTVILQT